MLDEINVHFNSDVSACKLGMIFHYTMDEWFERLSSRMDQNK